MCKSVFITGVKHLTNWESLAEHSYMMPSRNGRERKRERESSVCDRDREKQKWRERQTVRERERERKMS